MSLFKNVMLAPKDPILGVVEDFLHDPRSLKINLSIGVYTNEMGTVPRLDAIKQAQTYLTQHQSAKTYLPMDGLQPYILGVQQLLFNNQAAFAEQRIATIQSIGGTGALKIGADFLKKLYPNSRVYVSEPTWDNHIAIFANAGFEVSSYPYFDADTHRVNFNALQTFLKNIPDYSIIILHICCHNPTGADLTLSEWTQLADIIKNKNLIPFLDMAYQGFSKSIQEDVKPVYIMIEKGINCLISNSFSKSMSLYAERVGALSVVTQNKNEAVKVLSQLKQMIRGNYSSPPLHGVELAGCVLQSAELLELWTTELEHMKKRIKTMRQQLVTTLNNQQNKIDFSFINQQAGMFSYSGLNANQVEKLRTDYGIYILSTGRICIAALNENNIKQTVTGIVNVL